MARRCISPRSLCSLPLLLQHAVMSPSAMAAEEEDRHGTPLHLAAFFMFAISSSSTRSCVSFSLPFHHGSISPRSCIHQFFFFNMQLRPFRVPSAMVAPHRCVPFHHEKEEEGLLCHGSTSSPCLLPLWQRRRTTLEILSELSIIIRALFQR
ncbi:hypothetical protein S83_001259 [Arachis hypogaea]